jgi:hypothetical protein
VDELKLKFICIKEGVTNDSKSNKRAVINHVKIYVYYDENNQIKEINKDDVVKVEPLSNIFYGIVDRDDEDNEPEVNVAVLKRYSIENYIFDFIYVFFYLKIIKLSNLKMF